MNHIPNSIPTWVPSKRIALIGEAPGGEDVRAGRPFAGSSARLLAALLSRTGIRMEQCFLGHVCAYQPPGGDISTLAWSSEEVQDSLYQLRQDLEAFKPNIVVLLGNYALKAAKDPHGLGTGKKLLHSTAKWRGSLFQGADGSAFVGMKCLATYHPLYVLRDYEAMPLLMFDLRKASREADSPLLTLPDRRLITNLTLEQQVAALRRLREQRTPVALDIEGGIDTMSCISFADSPTTAFIVPIYTKAGDVLICPEVWRELALTLEDPHVPKILQNALYDRFVLHYSYGIRVQGMAHDTMLKHWELYSELEKSLGVQASIYTDEPYYKGDRKSHDDKTFYEYCCRDSAVTLEISNKLDASFASPTLCSRTPAELAALTAHYRMNVAMLNPFLYMELRGIRYNVLGASQRRAELLQQMHVLQAKLNGMTGHGFSFKSMSEIRQHAKAIFYTIKGERVRTPKVADEARFIELLHAPNPSLATIGELEDLCEVSLNVDSGKQFQNYLYNILKLPVQMSNVRGQEPHPTTDYEALLKLSRICTQTQNTLGFTVVQAAIELRALGTRAQMLSISADSDGRIRCGYNIVGSNTGRISCYESPTGSGYNLQTIPNYTSVKDAPGGILGDRDLFLADDDHWIFQCDLAGADGWTVAAYAAMLGDRTMLDDYLAGIKPAKVLALAMRGIPVPADRQALKEACRVVNKDDWDYFAGKRIQHGGAYLEGGLTISRNCLKDSEGKLYISPTEADAIKNKVYFARYWGIKKWHDWVARRLAEKPILVAASGQVRQFFGRPDDVLTKAVAFEPQANTTYATNLAAWRLWTDRENRINKDVPKHLQHNFRSLRIEPLHQVHDALIGQFRKSDTAWAVGKIKSYFNNPLTIAGQQITIPYEGGYGASWGGKQEGAI